VIFLERVNTQSRKYEEYAYVLDYSSQGKSKTVRGRDGVMIIALGEERLTLLEILGVEDSTFDVGEKIYIGKEGRTKVQSVLGKLDYEQTTGSAQSELDNVVKTIVTENEERFVNYINNAQPLTPRRHSLELIPGIGKTYLKLLIEEINKQKFLNYQDLEERAGLKEPVIHLSKRIIEEIKGETQFKLFVKR
jgi:putative nucleotide binding protein|tara:strand:+ start:1335 stop:1910 length:576 start_codon:yes stop_codon:yes gene_type:complete